MSNQHPPLVVVERCRNGSNVNRRVKLLYMPLDLFDDIAAHSQGPLNQVLVELINKAWAALRRTGTSLHIKDPRV